MANLDYLRGPRATLLVSLYARALESQSPSTILADDTSFDIAGRLQADWTRLKVSRGVQINAAMRARHMDIWTHNFVVRYPNAVVLDLASGLDPRITRVDPAPGIDWYDVDYPDIIAIRRPFFSERVGHHMIGADLTADDWLDPVPRDRPTIIIMDGVQPFISDSDFQSLFRRLTGHFRSGEIVLYVISKLAARLLPRNPVMQYLGIATAYPGFDDPHTPERWGLNLQLVEEIPLVKSILKSSLPLRFRLLFALIALNRKLSRDSGRVLRYSF
ncbi:class I SAM-dependent methyltransferase [Sphingomonas sp. So64.6b]|uniref:class I SAM-dependent methyltransferase n=1 Tax=Sphingomonas sp. So64.6b TaxID=2997354 RepID=UPI001AED5D32|nr:class I SAM-dependent methyltransferase [Sphingomonas sp. So64.6b]